VENIVGEVIRGASIPWDRLYSLTRGREGAHGCNLVAYLARKLAGFRIKEIAQHFNREPMTISLGVKKVENLLLLDKEFSKRVEIMEMNLKRKRKKKYFITIAWPQLHLGEGTSDLNGLIHKQISRDIATAQRLKRCLEKLGGYPEWLPDLCREVEAFANHLSENQCRARLLGKKVDAALEDPRWMAADKGGVDN
jgi:hypothetical protein